MKSFQLEFLESFRRSNSHIISIISVIVTVLAFYISPETRLSVGWVVPILCALIIISFTLGDLSFRGWKSATKILPDVVATTTTNRGCASFPLILIEPSPLFGIGMVVSVWQRERQFEQLIGCGVVDNVQEDGRVQVRVISTTADRAELWQAISSGNISGTALIIKPSGQLEVVKEMLNE